MKKITDESWISRRYKIANNESIIILKRLESFEKINQQLNMFRITKDGTVIWQVKGGKYAEDPQFTFVGVEKIEGNVIRAYNYEGAYYEVDLRDGSILSREPWK